MKWEHLYLLEPTSLVETSQLHSLLIHSNDALHILASILSILHKEEYTCRYIVMSSAARYCVMVRFPDIIFPLLHKYTVLDEIYTALKPV